MDGYLGHEQARPPPQHIFTFKFSLGNALLVYCAQIAMRTNISCSLRHSRQLYQSLSLRVLYNVLYISITIYTRHIAQKVHIYVILCASRWSLAPSSLEPEFVNFKRCPNAEVGTSHRIAIFRSIGLKDNRQNIGLPQLPDFNYRTSNIGLSIVRQLSDCLKSTGLTIGNFYSFCDFHHEFFAVLTTFAYCAAGPPSAIQVCDVPIVSAAVATVLVVSSCCCCWCHC